MGKQTQKQEQFHLFCCLSAVTMVTETILLVGLVVHSPSLTYFPAASISDQYSRCVDAITSQLIIFLSPLLLHSVVQDTQKKIIYVLNCRARNLSSGRSNLQ
jgi:hypothetical protein